MEETIALSVLDASDVLELDGDEAVGLVDELDILGVRAHLGREADLDTRIGSNLMIAHGRTLDLFTPVSYTHLDVYKRQVIENPFVRHTCCNLL